MPKFKLKAAAKAPKSTMPEIPKGTACLDDDAGAKAASGGKVASCEQAKRMCQHQQIGEVVRQNCPKMCGVCGGTAAAPICVTVSDTTCSLLRLTTQAGKAGSVVGSMQKRFSKALVRDAAKKAGFCKADKCTAEELAAWQQHISKVIGNPNQPTCEKLCCTCETRDIIGQWISKVQKAFDLSVKKRDEAPWHVVQAITWGDVQLQSKFGLTSVISAGVAGYHVQQALKNGKDADKLKRFKPQLQRKLDNVVNCIARNLKSCKGTPAPTPAPTQTPISINSEASKAAKTAGKAVSKATKAAGKAISKGFSKAIGSWTKRRRRRWGRRLLADEDLEDTAAGVVVGHGHLGWSAPDAVPANK